MAAVLLATDGSCLRRAGPGGWAVVLQSASAEAVYVGNVARTTSHRMELTAFLRGLEALPTLTWPPPTLVTLLTDCESLANVVTDRLTGRALPGHGVPLRTHRLKDADLWRAVAASLPPCPLQVTWVPSRSHRLNQQADALARSAALFADRAILHPTIRWA